jgi:hypothetical protein
VRVGVVTGDDLLPRLDELLGSGHELRNMDTGEALDAVRDRVLSANAYIGSTPIVEALARGANVVVTGRSTDTALTMAPLRHEFGWGAEDWDRLAAGIVAGHILECGAQCSGGNCLHDWRTIPDLANVGYRSRRRAPTDRSSFTKHPGTGGRVSFHSVAEQLVYEMGDPRSYITPDVVPTSRASDSRRSDPTACACTGSPASPRPTSSRSASPSAAGGRRSARSSTHGPTRWRRRSWPNRVLRERLDRLGLRFDEVLTEYVGANATHGPLAGGPPTEAAEVQLPCGVRGADRASVERFTREIAPLVLNGPPSVTGFAGGRPKVEEIVAYWPALVDKSVVQTKVEVLS